jgi:hypothetical protein
MTTEKELTSDQEQMWAKLKGITFAEALSMLTSDAYVDVSGDDWYREYFFDWHSANNIEDYDWVDNAKLPHFARLNNKQLWADVEQWHAAWKKEYEKY